MSLRHAGTSLSDLLGRPRRGVYFSVWQKYELLLGWGKNEENWKTGEGEGKKGKRKIEGKNTTKNLLHVKTKSFKETILHSGGSFSV